MEKIKCVCEGNWRKLVHEYDHLIGKTFRYNEEEFKFFGLVHAEDDYYFGMLDKKSKLSLWSCVGNFGLYGLELVEE